jgi:hypothetical protein
MSSAADPTVTLPPSAAVIFALVVWPAPAGVLGVLALSLEQADAAVAITKVLIRSHLVMSLSREKGKLEP